MKILVPIKLTYDVSQMKFDANTLEPILDAVPKMIGDADKCALEEALKIKDKLGGEVVVASVGNSKTHGKIIRDAFAMGASYGYIIEAAKFHELDVYTVGRSISELVSRTGPYNLILIGLGSSDTHSSQLPPLIATLLDIPVVIGVDKLEYTGDTINVTCSYEDGIYKYSLKPPAVISVTTEANMPRIPTIRDILRAKKMKFEEIPIEELIENPMYIDIGSISKYTVERKRIILEADTEEKIEEGLGKIFEALKSEGVI